MKRALRHQRVLVLCCLLAAGWMLCPPSGTAEGERASSSGDYLGSLKERLKSTVAGPVSARAFEAAPVFVYLAGWDFQDHQWKINEVANQMIHMVIGSVTNHFPGRTLTLCIAVGIEARQFFGKDACDLKLPDRIRDVAFYLIF
jgi:hypothetical protein